MAYTFISGATGGIGKAFAEACAARGDDLFLTGRSAEKLTALEGELRAAYKGEVLVCACDLSDAADRARLLAFADQKGARFSRAVHVAGVDIQKAFCDYTEEKVLLQLRVNGEATIALTHALLKRGAPMEEIIVISSMSGVTPMPYFALYSATKRMLISFFTALRLERKGKTRITTVLPGGVYTRPDIVQDIENQGIWGKLSAKTPGFVAKKSLKAARKNKAVYIPGFFNKFLNFVMKIVPKSISMRFIAHRWKKQTKDAF